MESKLSEVLRDALELRSGRKIRASIVFLILLPGCSSDSLRLGPEWAPLEWIRGTGLQAERRSTTIGKTVWVSSLDLWLKNYPEPYRTAILLHEQYHAVRQEADGLWSWLLDYATDPVFARDEEEAGWALQLGYLKEKGIPVDVERTIRSLRKYRHLADGTRLWSKERARTFAESMR
ncbi:hypothetical protein LCGC14_1281970 [marine sediment metagenome]|uniref:Uncharacterized protein n=1 Tax=marine sediment metagenome TaxID=412755 RepID=A0A0F9NY08_9ZZZZ